MCRYGNGKTQTRPLQSEQHVERNGCHCAVSRSRRRTGCVGRSCSLWRGIFCVCLTPPSPLVAVRWPFGATRHFPAALRVCGSLRLPTGGHLAVHLRGSRVSKRSTREQEAGWRPAGGEITTNQRTNQSCCCLCRRDDGELRVWGDVLS